MKKLVLLLFSVLSLNIMAAMDPLIFLEGDSSKGNIVNQIKRYSIKEWGKDDTMVDLEFRNQMNAFKWLSRNVKEPEVFYPLFYKWGENYMMEKSDYLNLVSNQVQIKHS